MSPRNKPNHKLRKKFGQKVRSLREEQGLSQEELGFKADLHRTYIGAVERGEQNISLDNIGRLAKVLKIKTYELFEF